MDADKSKLVGGRLRALRNALSMTQQEFSDTTGLDRGYLATMEVGTKYPSSNVLLSLKETTGVSVDWLLTGDGEMFSNSRRLSEGEHIQLDPEDLPRLPCGLYGEGGLVYVPLSSQSACCGPGFMTFDDYDIGESVVVRQSALGRLDPERQPFAIETQGRSMEGYGVREGSTVIVNPAEDISSGDIVMAVINEKASIKKYYERKDGIELHSSAGEPLRFSGEEMEDGWGIRICGRVMLVIAPPEDGV